MNTYRIGQYPQFDSHINHTVSDTREYMEFVILCVYVCVCVCVCVYKA